MKPAVDATRLFATQAPAYAVYRPTYPAAVFERVAAHAAAHGTGVTACAVDVATGSGQAVPTLAARYDRVVALDAQPAQLAAAPPLPNVEWRVGQAEETGLPEACADLLTAAQALHWFQVPAFYAEAARVLKPRGTLAAWGYDMLSIEPRPRGDEEEEARVARANAALRRAFDAPPVGPHWDARRALVDAHYAGMEPPSALFANLQVFRGDDALRMERSLTLAQLVGYMRTWSAYSSFMHASGVAQGGADDPAEQLRAALCDVYCVAAGQEDAVTVPTVCRVPLMLATRVDADAAAGAGGGGVNARVLLQGGCVCSAVRFSVAGAATAATYCNCGQCRRACAAPAVAWFSAPRAGFAWTLGAPRTRRSSPKAIRSFCGDCGTQLTFELAAEEGGAPSSAAAELDIATLSLDAAAAALPDAVRPTCHIYWRDGCAWYQRGLAAEGAAALPRFDTGVPCALGGFA